LLGPLDFFHGFWPFALASPVGAFGALRWLDEDKGDLTLGFLFLGGSSDNCADFSFGFLGFLFFIVRM